MNRILSCCAVLLLSSITMLAVAQVDVSIRDLSISQGLSQSTVYCIYQDSRGFLWIGTQGGLNVYNGREMRTFRHDPDDINSLPHNEVHTIAEDEKGGLLVGTVNGLARLDPATGEVQRYSTKGKESERVESDFYAAILPALDGSFWVSSFDGVRSFNPESGTAGESLEVTGEFTRVNYLYEDSKGRIWFGTRPAMIYVHDPATDETRRIELPDQFRSEVPPAQQLFRFAFLELPDGRMLVGASLHGLYYLDPETETFESVNVEINEMIRQKRAVITDVTLDRFERIWVATFGAGLLRLTQEGDLVQAYGSANAATYGFDSDNLVDLFVDNTGTLWVGTVDRGVKRVQFDPFERLTHAPNEEFSLSDKVAVSVFEDSEGILWVGHFHGLDRVDLENQTTTTYSQLEGPGGPFVLNNIAFVRELNEETLFLSGFPLGILRVDKATMRAEKISTSPLVFNIHWRDPSRAWYSAINLGFFRIDFVTGEEQQFTSLGESGIDLTGRFVVYVYEDRKGTLWIGTNDGLYSFDFNANTGRSYRYDPDNSADAPAVRNDDIISISESSTGTIWVCTGGGLYGLVDGEVEYEFTTDNGLPDDMVYSVVNDGDGYLWAGTNDGMVRIDPESGMMQKFNIGNGLPSREFNQGAVYRTDDGRIYFGTMNGAFWFDPSEVGRRAYEPPVFITAVSAGEEHFQVPVFWPGGEPLSLQWEERDLTFSFAALDYSQPEFIQYRYMLDGYDSVWRHTAGMPSATYTNVPSGSYTFRVQATNAAGVWGRNEADFSFSMAPQWWGSWWFIGLQIAVGVGLFLGAVYIVTTHSRRQKNTLERKIAEATAEMRAQHNELTIANRELEMFNYSVSHDLRSPLHVLHEYSSILVQDFADQIDDEGRDLLGRIQRSAERMNVLLESLLTLSRVTKAELHRENVDLSLITIEIAEDLKARNRDRAVEFHISKGVDVSCDENLMRIVMQNLMENAWKYTGKSNDAHIEFGEELTNGGTRHYFVRDNGIGFDMSDAAGLFDPFKRLASGKDFPGTGVGLATVQRAIHRHGGKVWAEGELEAGATFYFTLD